MKKSLLSLTMALAVGGAGFQVASLPVYAAESSAQKAGRAAIAALYKRNDQAMIKKDMPTLNALLAPNYQMTMKNGQSFNRAQSVALMQQLVSGSAGVKMSYSKVSTRILSLTWRGKEAVVMSEVTAIGKGQGGGREFSLQQVSASRDIWTPTAQGWKIRQSVETKSNVLVNGQRVS